VYVTQDTGPGAMHYGCMGTEIYISTKSSPATSNGYRLLLQAELIEVFEAAIGTGWNCGYNNGEGLSRVLATDSYPADELKPFVTSDVWLDKTPPGRPRRENWVDYIDPEDTNQFSIGCSVLILNWMRWVLGRSWQDIVGAGAPTLAGTYEKLFSRDDAWVRFKAEIDAHFPEGSLSGLTTDNPFRVQIWRAEIAALKSDDLHQNRNSESIPSGQSRRTQPPSARCCRPQAASRSKPARCGARTASLAKRRAVPRCTKLPVKIVLGYSGTFPRSKCGPSCRFGL
jgi:hypothetical protein